MNYGVAVNGQVQEQRFETKEEAVVEARSLRSYFGGRARVQAVHVETFLGR